MQDVVFRWATRWDREAIRSLLTTLAAEHGMPTTPEVLDEALDFALRNPDRVRFCVAQRDRAVVGLAGLHVAYSTWRGKPYGTVEDVHVAEGQRRRGIARGMLDFLKAEARRRGYCRLSLHVREDNRAARAAYEKWGLAAAGELVYSLNLEEEPASPPSEAPPPPGAG
jgi:ribosomal protein S18 acetylase RimI-like enzyme